MDNQGLSSVTYAYSLSFGIDNDRDRFVNIGILIDIDVTITRSGLDYGNRRIFNNGIYKSCTTSGNKNIYVLIHLHKLSCNRSVRIFNELYRIGIDAAFPERSSHNICNLNITVYRITSAF